MISSTDPLGRTTSFSFTSRNLPSSITGPDPDGSGPLSAPVRSFGYDLVGNRTSVTDALGRETLTAYDAQNRILSQTLPDPDGSGPLSAPLTSYSYTLAGQLASLTDPVGNVTNYEYDHAGRLTAVGDPIYYQYDAAKQVIGITDRNGRQRDFTYNDLGLKTSETWLDENDDPVRVISWNYDDAGQLISASDPDSSYTYTYDLVGNVTSVDNADTPNVPNVVLNFGYDYAGNRTVLWDNLGDSIGYTYTNHRLANMSWTVDNAAAGQVAFGYDAVGRTTTITRTSANWSDPQIVTAFTYDDGDHLIDITHTANASGQDPIGLSQFGYAFDIADQVIGYSGPDGTLEYAYDNTGQLIGVSGDRSESYSYDENGNRTMTGYTTGAENRLASDGTYDYTYDDEGNQLTKTRISDGQVTANTWDYRNRLTHVVVRDAEDNIIAESRYTYDVFDRRIGVWEDADGDGAGDPTERWTVYDGDNPYADFDADGDLTAQYLYGPDIDQIIARAHDEALEWYLTDRLGSVRQLVQSNGTVQDEISYDSFGQILSESNASAGDRFKFTAREWDALTEQYNYRARYYAPDIGRFTKEDPLSFGAGDSNVYRYVANIPTNATDPSGMLFLGFFPTTGAEWSAFHEGATDGALMIYNAGTFHLDTDVNNYVNNAIAQNGGGYQTANVFAHIGAYAAELAAVLAILNVAGVPGTNPWIGSIAIHGPHHTFAWFGRAWHLQFMLRCGRHLTRHLRIPFWPG